MKPKTYAAYLVEVANRPGRFLISCFPTELVRILAAKFPEIKPCSGDLRLMRISPDQIPSDAVLLHASEA
jgi:hypothetical protein